MEHSSGAVRTACDIQVVGKCRPGTPKMTCEKMTENNCCEWKFTTDDPQERRSGIRSNMPKASKQPGGWPSDVDDTHALAH